jgi:hypothetical protein
MQLIFSLVAEAGGFWFAVAAVINALLSPNG